MWLVLFACGHPTYDTGLPLPDVQLVKFHVDPDPPMATEPATVWLQVVDAAGNPVQDIQTTHDRVVHTFVISRDLQSFEHKHQEDTEPITADDLKTATFHFPESFPYSGDFLLYFNWASHDLYFANSGWQTVDGSPAQLDAPIVDLSTDVDAGDIHVELVWDVPPVAGETASWHVHLTHPDGSNVTDVVQWLGADSHVALVDSTFDFVAHTHAWFDGMSSMPPDHEMPHLYDGPDIPYEYAFPSDGIYKMWVQFARASNPDVPYTVPFMFTLGPP